jgi:hypothetical protein
MWGAAVVMPAAPCFFCLDIIDEFSFAGYLAHTLAHTSLDAPRKPAEGPSDGVDVPNQCTGAGTLATLSTGSDRSPRVIGWAHGGAQSLAQRNG